MGKLRLRDTKPLAYSYAINREQSQKGDLRRLITDAMFEINRYGERRFWS